ncbi:hypothetical protein YC2023_081800 [Brassica napus]
MILHEIKVDGVKLHIEGKYVTTRKIGRVEHEETIVNRDSRYNDRVGIGSNVTHKFIKKCQLWNTKEALKNMFRKRSEATSTKHTRRWNELVLVVRAARWSSGQWGSACATPFPCFQESFLSLVTFHNEERPKWQSGSDHGG